MSITAIFRLGCLMLFVFPPSLFFPIFLIPSFIILDVFYLLPYLLVSFLVLNLLKPWCSSIRRLSGFEMFQALSGELITITIWPQLERVGSRGIQLCMMIFHLLHNVTYIICIYYEYYKQKQDGNSFSLWQNLGREQDFLTFCGLLVICGLISSVLSLLQIFIKID